jgi:hypothetical protein
LLADVRGDELARFTAEGHLGAERQLGGDAALQPPPKPTPVKRIVLWIVLVGGVGLLIAMALSLLRRLRVQVGIHSDEPVGRNLFRRSSSKVSE